MLEISVYFNLSVQVCTVSNLSFFPFGYCMETDHLYCDKFYII